MTKARDIKTADATCIGAQETVLEAAKHAQGGATCAASDSPDFLRLSTARLSPVWAAEGDATGLVPDGRALRREPFRTGRCAWKVSRPGGSCGGWRSRRLRP
ncbi:hypothetical protein GCM10010343_12670 [Streptomyces avidinii]|nr:hypothetical protein GCM10010343_12670 [Streptomyces avidinii]